MIFCSKKIVYAVQMSEYNREENNRKRKNMLHSCIFHNHNSFKYYIIESKSTCTHNKFVKNSLQFFLFSQGSRFPDIRLLDCIKSERLLNEHYSKFSSSITKFLFMEDFHLTSTFKIISEILPSVKITNILFKAIALLRLSKVPTMGRSSSSLISSQDFTEATVRESKLLQDALLGLFAEIENIANCLGSMSCCPVLLKCPILWSEMF
uniref:Uncharacterized protein n=1 Tax=Heterorhabditis bacteriophora TaxID=37862 RepID=A0A1I7WIA0_HETBA